MKKNKTRTQSFGSSGRQGHDSSPFYESKLYKNLDFKEDIQNNIENSIQKNVINQIFLKSSTKMSELPDNSIHLMITSPPYNVSKDYDENLSLEEYLNFLNRSFVGYEINKNYVKIANERILNLQPSLFQSNSEKLPNL